MVSMKCTAALNEGLQEITNVTLEILKFCLTTPIFEPMYYQFFNTKQMTL